MGGHLYLIFMTLFFNNEIFITFLEKYCTHSHPTTSKAILASKLWIISMPPVNKNAIKETQITDTV